jgi:hypothetical protein
MSVSCCRRHSQHALHTCPRLHYGRGLTNATAAAGAAAHLLLCSSLIQHPLLLSFLQSSSRRTKSISQPQPQHHICMRYAKNYTCNLVHLDAAMKLAAVDKLDMQGLQNRTNRMQQSAMP